MSAENPDPRLGLPSGSSMQRTMSCPAWIGRVAGSRLVSLPEKKWTSDGTLAHDVLSGEVDEEEVEDDDDLASAIRTCKIHEEKMLIAIGFEEYETHVEKRSFLLDDDGNQVASGQPDRVHIARKQFAIIDYKTGRKDVPAPSLNPQLIFYALLAAQDYGVTEGYLGISYAWSQTPPMAFINSEQLASWRLSILGALDAAKEEKPHAEAGEHCLYCPHRWECPEAWELVAEANETLKDHNMNADQFAVHYDLAKHAEGTIKAFFEQVKARLVAEPGSLPGLNLGKASEMKTIPGSESAWDLLTRLYSPQVVLAATKWSPAGLAKAITGGKGAKAAQKTLEEELADIIRITPKSAAIERVT